MALTVDTTISGEFANSFVNVAYADDYFDNHYDTTKQTTWGDLDDGPKNALLVQAASIINSLRFTYPSLREDYELEYDSYSKKVISLTSDIRPLKRSYLQNLQFPRNIDVHSQTGVAYIPEDIKIAQCEQAIALKGYSSTSITKVLGGIKREMVEIGGQITQDITYADSGTMTNVGVATVDPLALQYVSKYLLRSMRLERV